MSTTAVSFAALLALSLVMSFGPPAQALPRSETAVHVEETIFLSGCMGRGKAVRLCRKKRNGFCRAIRCIKETRKGKGTRRGFRCRCRALPSPSPINVAPNRRCIPGMSKCSPGYTCSCGGRCRREVTLKIIAAGDDALKIYTCGKTIGGTPSFDKLAVIKYTGACDNIIVEATNKMREPERRNPVGMAVFVEMGTMKFGTKSVTDGVEPLDTVGTFDPADGFEMNKVSFDYSDWTPVVVVPFLTQFPNIGMLNDLGAQPVCTSPDTVEPGPYAFRIDAPYC